MRKILVLMIIVILALTINLPDSGITGFFVKVGITGFFVKVGITGFALAKEILKTILTFVLKLLG
jgi:nitrogen regulatory protein PII-like uncharacterized protein